MSRASARLSRTKDNGFELAPHAARPLGRELFAIDPGNPAAGVSVFSAGRGSILQFVAQYSGGAVPEYLPGLVIDTAKLAERCYAGPPGPTQRGRELLENYRFSPDRLFPGGIRVSNRPPGFDEWSEDYARLADAELSTRQFREPSPLSDIRQSLLELVNYMQQAADSMRVFAERIGPALWIDSQGCAHQVNMVIGRPGFGRSQSRAEEVRQTYEDRLDARRVQMQIEYESRWWNTPAPLDEELHEALPQGYELSLDPTPAGKGDPLAGVLGGMDRLLSRIDELVD